MVVTAIQMILASWRGVPLAKENWELASESRFDQRCFVNCSVVNASILIPIV